MECISIEPQIILQNLIDTGHVTTRRVHHARGQAYSMDDFSSLGFIDRWRDRDDGRMLYVPRMGVDDMANAYKRLVVDPFVDSFEDRSYDEELYPDGIMTYRMDVLGDKDPAAFKGCFSAFEVYALIMGPDHPARFVPGIDEVCELTAHQLHCNYLDVIDAHPGRLAPDEHDIEVITNLLRIREFLVQDSISLDIVPYFKYGLINAEKWLSRIEIELDDELINPLDDRLKHADVSKISLLTTLGVMLDSHFYLLLQTYRPEVEMYEFTGPGSQDLGRLYNCGFQLAQFYTQRKKY